MARNTRKPPLLRPASVAVHDDGHMPRNALKVNLLKELFLDRSLLEVAFEIRFYFPDKDGHERRAARSIADRNQKQPFGRRRRSGIGSVLGAQNSKHIITGNLPPANL